MGIIIGIILALVAIGGIAGFFAFYDNKNKMVSTICVVVAILAVIAFLIVPFSIRTVESGEIAVVKHLGEAKKVRTPGTYFDFWITDTYKKYDSRVQNLELTTMAYSKDAQTMDIAMTVQYQINQSKGIEITNRYGGVDVIENRIGSVAIEKTKSALSAYSAMSIIENRSNISPEVEESIKLAIDEEYYVDIVAVILTNIDFSDAFEQTVEDKMIAEQEKLKAQYEKETAIVNAEKELEVAKLNAQAKIEQAKADAAVQVEIANAEARAIKIKTIEIARAMGFKIDEQTITNEDGSTNIEYTINFEGRSAEEINTITEYLKYIEYLAKWDGKLPGVVTGDTATVVIPAV